MKQFMVVAVVILGGALAAYYYWQQTQPEPEAVKVTALPPPIAPPTPVVRQVVNVPEAKSPLPQLGESDSFMLEALASLMGKESLMKVFRAYCRSDEHREISGAVSAVSAVLRGAWLPE